MRTNRESGFTLVEVMAAAAIVGIMAAVAIPNYLKYAARAKQTEAKVSLASILVAESAFHTEYNYFTSCLSDIGYKPAQGETRYYTVGFKAAASNAALCGANGATNCSMVGPNSCGATIGAVAGGEAVTTYGNAFSSNALAKAGLGYPKDGDLPTVGLGVNNFSAGAAGNISTSASGFDTWTIDANKSLANPNSGI